MIKKILTDRGIKFKGTGEEVKIKCLNPEHTDSHPSMGVNTYSGVFHCLSCGFKGNIFKFFGLLPPPNLGKTNEVLQLINERLQVLEPLEIPESATMFSDDYRGISASTLQRFSAFIHSDYESRLVLPISNHREEIVAFLTREMYSSNTRNKYIIFPAGKSLPVYPTHKRTTKLVLVEGIFDVMNLVDKGCDLPVSAIFGTKTFINNIESKLQYYLVNGLQSAIILLDNDKAGNSTAEQIKQGLDGLGIKVAIANSLLPDSKDPGDLNKEETKLLTKQLVDIFEKL